MKTKCQTPTNHSSLNWFTLLFAFFLLFWLVHSLENNNENNNRYKLIEQSKFQLYSPSYAKHQQTQFQSAYVQNSAMRIFSKWKMCIFPYESQTHITILHTCTWYNAHIYYHVLTHSLLNAEQKKKFRIRFTKSKKYFTFIALLPSPGNSILNT